MQLDLSFLPTEQHIAMLFYEMFVCLPHSLPFWHGERAVVFFPAVTIVFCGGCFACLEDFSVVLLNYGLQVVCAAITN